MKYSIFIRKVTTCIIMQLFCCLSANAQITKKAGTVTTAPTLKPTSPTLKPTFPTLKPKKQPKYDTIALAKTVLEDYIQNADTIRTGDRKRKINTYIFFYTKENVDIKNEKVKNCLVWNKNKEIFTQQDAFPLVINNLDSIKYRFIEIVVKKDTVNTQNQRLCVYFDTNNYFRGSKTDKMQLVETPPDCTPRTIRKIKNEAVVLAPINCLNTDAYFEYNKKTKKWSIDSNFDRNIERRTWFLKKFLF